jgi:phospholipase/carboxylesterase
MIAQPDPVSSRKTGVVLHGRGGSLVRMREIGERIGAPGMRWIVPAAPGASWYPERFMEPLAANEPFLTQAVDACARAMHEASEGGAIAPADRIVVGFSQGACLALEYALRHPGECGAVVAFTGGLIGPPGTVWQPAQGSLAGLHVLLSGSDIDQWVPEARVRETARVLAELGATVRLRIYTGKAHSVTDAEIVEARQFLEQVV